MYVSAGHIFFSVVVLSLFVFILPHVCFSFEQFFFAASRLIICESHSCDLIFEFLQKRKSVCVCTKTHIQKRKHTEEGNKETSSHTTLFLFAFLASLFKNTKKHNILNDKSFLKPRTLLNLIRIFIFNTPLFRTKNKQRITEKNTRMMYFCVFYVVLNSLSVFLQILFFDDQEKTTTHTKINLNVILLLTRAEQGRGRCLDAPHCATAT